MEAVANWASDNHWVVFVFTTIFFTLVARVIAKFVFDRLAKKLELTKNSYDDALLFAIRKPVSWAIWILGFLWAAQIAREQADNGTFEFIIEPARELSVIFLIAWFALRFIHALESNYANRDKSSSKDKSNTREVDMHTAQAVGKLLRASVVITALLISLQTVGFSVEGVLAFGGIGGIAVGFAARDMLANFFGAIMLFLDKPFTVGEWIRSPDKDIEGTVEEIGWRMTHIRTFDQRPLYVPNSTFANLTVENPDRMYNRRIYEYIGVRYNDITSLPAILQDVKGFLENHPAIDTHRTLMVNLVQFSASSVDFFIYTFTRTTVWTEFHKIKEEVLFEIAEIISKHKAEMAFPTQTLHVESLPMELNTVRRS